MPVKPTLVPVPPELIVTFPTLLLAIVQGCELKYRMPRTGAVLAVVEVAVITIEDDPSRLPMMLPVTSPTLNRPSVVPKAMALKTELKLPVTLRPDVWLMPEMVFPCTLVEVVVLTFTTSSPRHSLCEPLIVVVPVPLAAPKPIVLPATVKAPALAFRVIPA